MRWGRGRRRCRSSCCGGGGSELNKKNPVGRVFSFIGLCRLIEQIADTELGLPPGQDAGVIGVAVNQGNLVGRIDIGEGE